MVQCSRARLRLSLGLAKDISFYSLPTGNPKPKWYPWFPAPLIRQTAPVYPCKTIICTNHFPNGGARCLEEICLTEKTMLKELWFFTSYHLAGNRNNCPAKHVGLMCVKCSPVKLLNVITVQAAFSHYIFLVAKPISMAAFLLPALLSFWHLWCGSRRQWDRPASSSGCGTMLDMGKRRQGLCNLTSSPRPSAALQAALNLCFPLRFPVTLLWQEMSCARHKGLGSVLLPSSGKLASWQTLVCPLTQPSKT